MNNNQYGLRWFCLTALCCLWLIFCKPWFIDGLVIPFDAKNHFYAMIRFAASAYHSGQSAAWNPSLFGGFPLLSDPQSILLTPSLWLPVALFEKPTMAFVDFVHLLHLLVLGGAIFGFGLNRQWHPVAALIAALIAMMGGAVSMRMEHVLMTVSTMWFAVSLWRLDVLILKGNLWRGIAFAIPLSLMLIDRDHVAYLGAWFLLIYWLVHAVPDFWRDKRPERITQAFKQQSPVLLGGTLAVCAALIPVLLLLQLAENSNRPGFGLESAAWQSLHPASVMTFLFPEYFGSLTKASDYWGPASAQWPDKSLKMHRGMLHFYLGTLPVALIIWPGILRGWLFQPGARIFTATALIMYFYALGRYTPFFPALYHIVPGIDLFRRPADGIFLFGISIALLTGVMASRLLSGNHITNDNGSRVTRGRVLLLLVLAVPIAVIGINLTIEHEKFSYLLSSLAIFALLTGGNIVLLSGAVSTSKWRPVFLGALVVFVSFDLLHHTSGIRANASAPDFYLLQERGTREPAFNKIARLLQEKDPSGVPWRIETIALGPTVQNIAQVTGFHNILGYNPIRLAGFEKHIGPNMQNNAGPRRTFGDQMTGYDTKLTNHLGIRFIVTGTRIEKIDPGVKPGRFTLIDSISMGNKTVRIYENIEALPRAVFRGGDSSVVPARVTSYRNSEIKIEVNTKVAGDLILHDFDFPGWEAEVNGIPVAIRREADLFRKVAVQAGKSEVIFSFRPLSPHNLFGIVSDLITGTP